MKKILVTIVNDIDGWITCEPLGSLEERTECVQVINGHLQRARSTVQYLYDIHYISYKDYRDFGRYHEQVYNHWLQKVSEWL